METSTNEPPDTKKTDQRSTYPNKKLVEEDISLPFDEKYVWQQYKDLCQGREMESKYKQRLSCYYTPMRLSYGFWRREQLHLSPDIHIFHHVLDTEALAGDLPHENNTTFEKSTTQGVDGLLQYQHSRTSLSKAAENDSHLLKATNKVLRDILSFPETVTLDSSNGPDPLQIHKYEPGGVFEPHFDFLGNNPSNTNVEIYGDRLFTAIFYLNDAHVGGYTVFPLLNLKIIPETGGVLIWRNLREDGSPDYRTLHAGCPVILGQKIVATKWVRERN